MSGMKPFGMASESEWYDQDVDIRRNRGMAQLELQKGCR